MYGYIYITKNSICNKKYIGKHKSDFFDPCYLGSGIYLKRAIKIYGRRNFVVKKIFECSSLQELNDMEIFLIEELDAVNREDFYNITWGGDGAGCAEKNNMFGKHHSEETKKILSNKLSGKNNPNFGLFGEKHPLYKRKRPEEVNRKISNSLKGKIKSAEWVEKMRKRLIGRTTPESVKIKISEATKGRKQTKEHIENMANAKRGKPTRKVICPICNKIGGVANMKRYHFNNCKLIKQQ